MIRFRSRHLLQTFVNDWRATLDDLGWVTGVVNFGTDPVVVLDYLPDDRAQLIQRNTVAISLGDYEADEEEELGGAAGGLHSAPYSIYFDVYMAEQALSHAMCDDIRDHYRGFTAPLVDQITGSELADTRIVVESVVGPERPAAQVGAEQFKKYWRIMRVDCLLYFQP